MLQVERREHEYYLRKKNHRDGTHTCITEAKWKIKNQRCQFIQ